MKLNISPKTVDYCVGGAAGLVVAYFAINHWPQISESVYALFR